MCSSYTSSRSLYIYSCHLHTAMFCWYQGSLSQNMQRPASMGLPPTVGSGSLGMSSGLSQTARQTSLGLPQSQGSLGLQQGQGAIGSATRQSSVGLPRSQGSLGLAPSGSLGTAQRQGSLGLPYDPSPQDLQVTVMHDCSVPASIKPKTGSPLSKGVRYSLTNT